MGECKGVGMKELNIFSNFLSHFIKLILKLIVHVQIHLFVFTKLSSPELWKVKPCHALSNGVMPMSWKLGWVISLKVFDSIVKVCVCVALQRQCLYKRLTTWLVREGEWDLCQNSIFIHYLDWMGNHLESKIAMCSDRDQD